MQRAREVVLQIVAAVVMLLLGGVIVAFARLIAHDPGALFGILADHLLLVGAAVILVVALMALRIRRRTGA
jgi:hypothetical protein